jgi:antitoxin (DNA-binding transcriptional repressor) of toxin-antitoxin stability system
MESHLTATEAARNFSDLVDRVLYRGEVFVVERGGRSVCRIVPACSQTGSRVLGCCGRSSTEPSSVAEIARGVTMATRPPKVKTAAAEPRIGACPTGLAVRGRRGRWPRTRGSAPLKSAGLRSRSCRKRLVVATRDKRSFPRIPGLQVVLW